jgi:hypothetical protein
MRKRILVAFKRHEIVIVVTVISVVLMGAMISVAWMLRNSIATPPYENLLTTDLDRVFATGYLRFREDDGTPYLKVELHNGTLWWIKRVEFDFDGVRYALTDSDAFRPLHASALRCNLRRAPETRGQIEYDLRIIGASGYAPADVHWGRHKRTIAGDVKGAESRN